MWVTLMYQRVLWVKHLCSNLEFDVFFGFPAEVISGKSFYRVEIGSELTELRHFEV